MDVSVNVPELPYYTVDIALDAVVDPPCTGLLRELPHASEGTARRLRLSRMAGAFAGDLLRAVWTPRWHAAVRLRSAPAPLRDALPLSGNGQWREALLWILGPGGGRRPRLGWRE